MSKVDELSVKGYSQPDISKILNIDNSAISRDILYLKQEAKKAIENQIHELLPYEYSNCIKSLDEIITESWSIAKGRKNG